MRFLRELTASAANMEKISKGMLITGYLLFIAAHIIGFFVYVYFDKHADGSTALYWYAELAEMAKEILGAVTVPVMLFEVLLIVRGFKIKV